MGSLPNHTLIQQKGPVPGQTYPINRPAVVIDRDASSDISILATGVTRRHARLTYQGNESILT